MSFLDVRIEELMTETDTLLLRSTQPYGWQGLYRSMRKGRLKKVVRVIDLACLVLLALALWTAINFFQTTEVLVAVKTGIMSSVLLLAAVQLKLSLMPHIQTERVLRQMKRIEILVLAKNHKQP